MLILPMDIRSSFSNRSMGTNISVLSSSMPTSAPSLLSGLSAEYASFPTSTWDRYTLQRSKDASKDFHLRSFVLNANIFETISSASPLGSDICSVLAALSNRQELEMDSETTLPIMAKDADAKNKRPVISDTSQTGFSSPDPPPYVLDLVEPAPHTRIILVQYRHRTTVVPALANTQGWVRVLCTYCVL